MKFEIKEGIPLPVGRGKPRKYDIPLEHMKVGEHILIELPKTKIPQEVKIIRNLQLDKWIMELAYGECRKRKNCK